MGPRTTLRVTPPSPGCAHKGQHFVKRTAREELTGAIPARRRLLAIAGSSPLSQRARRRHSPGPSPAATHAWLTAHPLGLGVFRLGVCQALPSTKRKARCSLEINAPKPASAALQDFHEASQSWWGGKPRALPLVRGSKPQATTCVLL